MHRYARRARRIAGAIRNRRRALMAAAVAATAMITSAGASATPFIASQYASNYSVSLVQLGPNGQLAGTALVFKAGDPNTLLLGLGLGSQSAIYAYPVTRGADGHVASLQVGAPRFFASAPALHNSSGIDGGLAYGPNGVLFYTTFADNTVGEIKPGDTAPSKQVSLTPLGINGSVGSLAFAPASITSPDRSC